MCQAKCCYFRQDGQGRPYCAGNLSKALNEMKKLPCRYFQKKQYVKGDQKVQGHKYASRVKETVSQESRA